MEKTKVNPGFVPIGKFVFSHQDALKFKKLIEEKLKKWNIFYTLIDKIIPDGTVCFQKDVDKVV